MPGAESAHAYSQGWENPNLKEQVRHRERVRARDMMGRLDNFLVSR